MQTINLRICVYTVIQVGTLLSNYHGQKGIFISLKRGYELLTKKFQQNPETRLGWLQLAACELHD